MAKQIIMIGGWTNEEVETLVGKLVVKSEYTVRKRTMKIDGKNAKFLEIWQEGDADATR